VLQCNTDRAGHDVYKPVSSEEQSGSFRRRKTLAGWSLSWTLT
jgi:hypothetical protein